MESPAESFIADFTRLNRVPNTTRADFETWLQELERIGMDVRQLKTRLQKPAAVAWAGEVGALLRREGWGHLEGGKPFGVYLGAGADIANWLQTFQADGLFIDRHGARHSELERYRCHSINELRDLGIDVDEYRKLKRAQMCSATESVESCREGAIILEMLCAGIPVHDRDRVRFESHGDESKGTTIHFPWNLLGESPQRFSIRYAQADVTQVSEYLHLLGAMRSSGNADFLHVRAGVAIPAKWNTFLPQLAARTRRFLVLDEQCVIGNRLDDGAFRRGSAGRTLAAARQNFSVIHSPDLDRLREKILTVRPEDLSPFERDTWNSFRSYKDKYLRVRYGWSYTIYKRENDEGSVAPDRRALKRAIDLLMTRSSGSP